MEMGMNSVERVKEYLEVEQEAPGIVEGKRPPAAVRGVRLARVGGA
jgi:hypothetical protein